MKRDTGELRHLILAFLQYRFVFLGGELPGICANEHAILKVVWHTLLLSASVLLMVTLAARSIAEILD